MSLTHFSAISHSHACTQQNPLCLMHDQFVQAVVGVAKLGIVNLQMDLARLSLEVLHMDKVNLECMNFFCCEIQLQQTNLLKIHNLREF